MGAYNFLEIEDTWPKSLCKTIEGGISLPMPGSPQTGIVVYFDVESLDNTIEKVKELGGSIIKEKMAVPGEGYLATCKDLSNNEFGLWQIDKQAK